MPKKAPRSLADPTRLKPIDKQDGLLQVIIETPKGSRNKFAFDPDQKIFTIKSVLPAGMSFPYDFGFLPRTIAPDGDPIDVLLLMDEPAFVGLQPARPISPRSSKNLSRRQASSSSNGSPPAPSPTDRVPSAHDSDPETQTGTVEAGKSNTLSATAIARVKPQSEARPCPK